MISIKDLPEKLAEYDLIAFWRVGDPWGIFSNWYPAAVDGFKTSEHAMMFAKAQLFDDMETADKITDAATPAEAKALGRQVRGFSSEVWDREKERIMLQILYNKFSQNDQLKAMLLATGDKVLVEASPLDKIWGIGMAAENKDIYTPACWLGENLLGFYLMTVRDMLKKEGK